MKIKGLLNWPPALILMFASAFKLYELAYFPIDENHLFQSQLLAVLQIQFEFSLACWLVSGVLKDLARRLAMLVFLVFSFIAVYGVFVGGHSCGCFGRLEIAPIVLFVANSVMIWLLLNWDASMGVSRFGAITLGVCALGSVFVWTIAISMRPEPINGIGKYLRQQNTIILEPSSWIGKEFPLNKFLEPSPATLEGEWVVLLVYPDCRRCRELIKSLMPAEHLILVDLSDGSLDNGFARLNVENGYRLTDNHRWFANAPVSIWLRNGIVISIDN